MTPLDIITAARSYLGVPYKHQGRTRSGLDCLGLPVLVARDLGIAVEDTDLNYPARADGKAMIAGLNAHCRRIDPGMARCGDILLFAVANPRPNHIGILSSEQPRRIIHAFAKTRKVGEATVSLDWRPCGAWRFPGVEA